MNRRRSSGFTQEECSLAKASISTRLLLLRQASPEPVSPILSMRPRCAQRGGAHHPSPRSTSLRLLSALSPDWKSRAGLLNPHERKVVAYHEMGHVIVATALPGMDPVHKVSMMPRGVGALRKYLAQLEQGAKLLLQKETLTREELPVMQELGPAVAAAAPVTI